MNVYFQQVARARAPFAPARCRVAILTGQSSFASSALSPPQIAFLRATAPPAYSIVETGFPYTDGPPFVDAPILQASLRNALQVTWTLRSRYPRLIANRLQQMIDATSERLVLITGSCGLQMANAAWPFVKIPAPVEARVIALGPACFGKPRMPTTIIRGRRDSWSRLFYSGPIQFQCECTHLGYWNSEEVRTLVRTLLR